jgi:HSP20 family protein
MSYIGDYERSLVPSLLSSVLKDFDPLVPDWIGSTRGQRGFPLDVIDEQKEYVVKADLPGVTKDKIELSMENQQLSITLREEAEKEEKNRRYLHRERRAFQVTRVVTLPADASSEVSAEFNDGVLTVRVKKEPEKQMKKIAIS